MSLSRATLFESVLRPCEAPRGFLRWDVLREFRTKNAGKEEETGGDREEEGGGSRPPRRGFQSQEGEEGFHDPWQEEEA